MENATLRDLPLEARYQVYSEDDKSALEDFYIPVLAVASRYDRLSGFFSSHALSLAASGVAALIGHGGKMRLICSPHLSQDDVDVLKCSASCIKKGFADAYFEKYFRPTESDIRTDHVTALAWMLREGLLEIKFAVVTDDAGNIKSDALFHPKVGIVEDIEGNCISFSGSNNETASGWTTNQEEFKVFKKWDSGQRDFYDADLESFESYWTGRAKNVKCFDLPSAFRERLIRASDSFSREEYVSLHYLRNQRINAVKKSLNLYDYQQEAIRKWEGNDRQLLFRMATGSGKTRTAIGCVNSVMEADASSNICCVIAVPTTDLCEQWSKELRGRLVSDSNIIVANSRNANWKDELVSAVSALKLSINDFDALVIITTHATASSDYFISVVSELQRCTELMLIGDECHGLGADNHRKALLTCYKYRIGLSATPNRMFDDDGTELLVQYFGGDDFQFGIREALRYNRVCPYLYHPVLVNLTSMEWSEYKALSERIAKLSAASSKDVRIRERLNQLLRDRASIVQAASEKLPQLDKLLKEKRSIFKGKALAFTCPKLFERVASIFADNDLFVHSYCEKDGDLRPNILNDFSNGKYDALIAMKCLDEGIDVPDARVEVLISSSTNPREYIQRLGRVIRKAQDKHVAEVFDFLVSPDKFNSAPLERDFNRAKYIASCALNSAEAIGIMFSGNGGR